VTLEEMVNNYRELYWRNYSRKNRRSKNNLPIQTRD
jgi:hypothetical protein